MLETNSNKSGTYVKGSFRIVFDSQIVDVLDLIICVFLLIFVTKKI